jgi:hypothetical protein
MFGKKSVNTHHTTNFSDLEIAFNSGARSEEQPDYIRGVTARNGETVGAGRAQEYSALEVSLKRFISKSTDEWKACDPILLFPFRV